MRQGGNYRVIVAEILVKGKPVRQSSRLFLLRYFKVSSV
jgi:hypothetical protein